MLEKTNRAKESFPENLQQNRAKESFPENLQHHFQDSSDQCYSGREEFSIVHPFTKFTFWRTVEHQLENMYISENLQHHFQDSSDQCYSGREEFSIVHPFTKIHILDDS